MKTFITGSELKALSKKANALVCRFYGKTLSLEFLNRSNDTRVVTEIFEQIDNGDYVFLLDYIDWHDTQWQYFLKSLKPKDEVKFHWRTNNNPSIVERGVTVRELFVVVNSKYHLILHTEHRTSPNVK